MTYNVEQAAEAVDKILERVAELGYAQEPISDEYSGDSTHAFVLEEESVKRVVRFRVTPQKIDLFHGVFTLHDGSRTLSTFRIRSNQKLNEVLHKIGKR